MTSEDVLFSMMRHMNRDITMAQSVHVVEIEGTVNEVLFSKAQRLRDLYLLVRYGEESVQRKQVKEAKQLYREIKEELNVS